MEHINEAFVGFDTSKLRNAVAIAESGRDREVRWSGRGRDRAPEGVCRRQTAWSTRRHAHDAAHPCVARFRQPFLAAFGAALVR